MGGVKLLEGREVPSDFCTYISEPDKEREIPSDFCTYISKPDERREFPSDFCRYISEPDKRREAPSDFCTYISEPDESIQMKENDSAIIQSDGDVTTTNGYDSSPRHHSGSVHLKCGSNRNGRRAAICQLDGNQTLNIVASHTSETSTEEYDNEVPMRDEKAGEV